MRDNSYILYLLSFIPTYVLGEINELLRRGINIRILMLGNSSRSAMWENITGLDKNSILSSNFIGSTELNVGETYIQTAEKISKLLIDENIGRIHTHFAKREAQVGIRLAKILGIPFSVITHANDIFVPRDCDELKYLLGSSTQVFTISEFNKNYLKKYLDDTQKIKVTHMGIDLNQLPQRIKKDKNIFSILSIASGLVEKKGIQYLIRACEILKKAKVLFKCTIVGSDPNLVVFHQINKQIKSLGLSEQIELPGIIPSENLMQKIAESDVFVLPCIQADNGDMDGIPVSLIEAMGIGVPVVSTSISGIPELIQDRENGLLISPKNSNAIVDAFTYIFKHTGESEKMGKLASQTVKNKFSIEGYINQLLDHWEVDSSKILSKSLVL